MALLVDANGVARIPQSIPRFCIHKIKTNVTLVEIQTASLLRIIRMIVENVVHWKSAVMVIGGKGHPNLLFLYLFTVSE